MRPQVNAESSEFLFFIFMQTFMVHSVYSVYQLPDLELFFNRGWEIRHIKTLLNSLFYGQGSSLKMVWPTLCCLQMLYQGLISKVN